MPWPDEGVPAAGVSPRRVVILVAGVALISAAAGLAVVTRSFAHCVGVSDQQASIVRTRGDARRDLGVLGLPDYPACAANAVAAELQLGVNDTSGGPGRAGPGRVHRRLRATGCRAGRGRASLTSGVSGTPSFGAPQRDDPTNPPRRGPI